MGVQSDTNTLLPLLKATPALSLDSLSPALAALYLVTILAIRYSVPAERASPTIALRYFSTQRSA